VEKRREEMQGGGGRANLSGSKGQYVKSPRLMGGRGQGRHKERKGKVRRRRELRNL